MRGWGAGALIFVAAMCTGRVAWAQAPDIDTLRLLSIDELANVRVTSVSKRSEPFNKAAAAIYVITSDDIHRSGASNLPEALRLAPNLEVVQTSSQSYAISARGFATYESANKMQVLVDGRSLYTTLHSGVFWDQEQLPLSDIERIEVIQGPGGTLYGANVVNGVINVITKHTRDTQGGLAELRYGSSSTGSLRYGGQLRDASYRVYGSGFARDNTLTADGRSAQDEWNGRQGGFRSDWAASAADALMVEGALYDNALEGGSIRGGNLVGRWDHQLDRGGSIQVQGYVDQVRRISPGVVDYLQSFDVQAQHAFDLGRSQQIVWGAGHHMTRDEFTNSLNFFVLDPTRDTVQLSNLFGQDAIALADDLTLTLGTKFEYSSFSVFEFLPNARLAWAASDSALFWAAVSRSVRTPSRIDRNLVAPGLLLRADDLKSEKLIAYELGYRGMVADRVLLSVSFYYHDYDDLRILINPPGTPFLQFGNAMHGSVFGAEVWADYQVTPWWRLSAGFNALKKDFTLEPTAVLVALDQHQGNDPRYQASLRSYMSLTDDISLYLAVRGVDDLPNPTVPGYVEADARVAWRVAPPLELALTGSNLLHDRHPESGLVATRNEIGRTIFAEMRWSF